MCIEKRTNIWVEILIRVGIWDGKDCNGCKVSLRQVLPNGLLDGGLFQYVGVEKHYLAINI